MGFRFDSIIKAALDDIRVFRRDTGERMDATAFFARELEQIRAKPYDVKLIELRALELIPLDTSVDPGAETVTYRQFTPMGSAKIVRDYANDFPRSDVKGAEFTGVIRSLGNSYGYSIQEIRGAMMANRPLDQMKANSARRLMDEQIDTILALGDTQNNLVGLLTLANTTSFAVPNGGTGQQTFASKTADEVLADLFGIENGIVSTTSEVEKPNTLLLPTAQYLSLSSRRVSTVSDTTILDFFLQKSKFVKTVESWTRLAGAGVNGTNRMLCYRKDPEALQAVVPILFEQFPPQLKNMEFITACHARVGGVECRYPLSISYGDGI